MMQHANLAPTSIALIVDGEAASVREVLHYVGLLPDSANLTVFAPAWVRNAIRPILRKRHVSFSVASSAHLAVRSATLAIVIGKSPFSERDVEILGSQGIPVENRAPGSGKKKRH